MGSIARFMPVLKGQLERGVARLEGYWTASEVEAACEEQEHVWRDRFWTPLRTISTFLLQALHPGSSCREAVALTLGQEAAAGPKDRPLPSGDPSAYAQGRKRLPLEVLRAGVRQVGQRLRDEVASTLTWCNRRVWLVDGTSCSMPDTPNLQKTFGQPTGQAPGCGFPVAKVVGLFCWASGAVLEAAVGPLRMSELSLWRTLWKRLSPGEIVLGDRFYCTFFDFVGVMRQGCDAVFRLHARRPTDLRRGRRVGRNDRLVTWVRPIWSARPTGMRWREWESLPETLTLRLIRFSVDIPGFRSRSITVATTLLDPVAYPASQIAALYRDRWLIELRFRDIKITLGMDVLRGKSADVVQKEILVHLMAYNLIRALMWQAAARHGCALHRMSFAGTVGRLNSVMPYLWLLEGSSRAERLYELLLQWIAEDPLPDRPNRLEPRVVKRRPKQYTFMKRPRQQLRRILLSRRVSYA
jgi:hypothetical protein